MSMKFYWRHLHFALGFHHGLKKYYVEVYNYKTDWLEEERYDFETFKDAFDYLAKFGYHNIGRFLIGD
jgi:hypothetical protein